MDTRRNFIRRIVPVTAMLGSSTGCGRLQVSDGQEVGEFKGGAIEKLRGGLKGRLILPTDFSYEGARRGVLLERANGAEAGSDCAMRA